jgi:hypothetical protein
MKIRMFDSLGEDGARHLTGCKVIDESGEPIGTVEGLWMDSSTRRVEYIGVKTTWLSGNVHVVPARDAEIIEHDNLTRIIRYPVVLIKGASSFSPEAELAQVEKEEINGHGGRSVATRRSNSIDEIRPEQAKGDASSRGDGNPPGSEQAAQDRNYLKRNEQAFFNQNGFVDAMPEVNVSEELRRTQKEAKARNEEDRRKNGSLD